MSNKFRDEQHPKWGLIRSREFLMKDLYSFDADRTSGEKTYEAVTGAYLNFFDRLGVPFHRVEGDSGLMGGNDVSHEYHFPADIGQDRLLTCAECNAGKNLEVDGEQKCTGCGRDMVFSRGIEEGNWHWGMKRISTLYIEIAHRLLKLISNFQFVYDAEVQELLDLHSLSANCSN